MSYLNSAADITIAIMFPCHSQHNWQPHSKCILICCDKFPGICIPHQETNTDATNPCSKINVHVYRNVSRYTVHRIIPYEEQTTYYICYTNISSSTPGKVYTQKELVLLEALIS